MTGLDRWNEILPDSAEFRDGSLWIGGSDTRSWAEAFGTPLYVYDTATLRASARRVCDAFRPLGTRVSFATKACSTPAVLSIFRQEGLRLDVVSAGELEAARRAGFPPESIHLHGNFKTHDELDRAVRLGLHSIVLDNLEELGRLEAICRRIGVAARAMIRIVLPIEAETHPHLQTSGYRSKFGLLRGSEEEREALRRLSQSSSVRLTGLHTHLGSQITDLDIYRHAAGEILALADQLSDRFTLEEVSLGGGWGVAYRPGDLQLDPEQVAEALAPLFADRPHLRLAVEPGRALVARAAMALYRVGSVKRFGDHRVIAVDGGMGDNPRPALYGARYSAIAAQNPLVPSAGPVQVVGRYCESGDVLVHEAELPELEVGDLICVPVSGAYQTSMASGYNLVPPPAVVMVQEGRAALVTRRGTIDDLLQREIAGGCEPPAIL